MTDWNFDIEAAPDNQLLQVYQPEASKTASVRNGVFTAIKHKDGRWASLSVFGRKPLYKEHLDPVPQAWAYLLDPPVSNENGFGDK